MSQEDDPLISIITVNWNGKKYSAIAHNFAPDHLALLPDGGGACSWVDGAGMPRINEDNTGVPDMPVLDFSDEKTMEPIDTNPNEGVPPMPRLDFSNSSQKKGQQ